MEPESLFYDEDMGVEAFFNQEISDWRSKMIKVYGDQHPYIFFVTAGHDFEDFIRNKPDTYDKKDIEVSKIFENLLEFKHDEKAVQEFYKILDELSHQKGTPELKEALDAKKVECAEVLDMFDEIVALCEKYFKQELISCKNRIEKHLIMQEPTLKEVKMFLNEVEEVGNSEIKSLRDKISKFVYGKGYSKLNYIKSAYSKLNKEPFAVELWHKCSSELTSKEIRSAFLLEQKELSLMWKKAYEDLIMLSTKLEHCRCNYNMTKFKLEREIFWMSRDYKEKMPELTKNQRRLSNLVDQKVLLKSELKNLQADIQVQQKNLEENRKKIFKKIVSMKNSNRFAQQASVKKFLTVMQTKKEEIYSYLVDIVQGDEFIHKKILGKNWDSINVSHLKPTDEDNESSSSISSLSLTSKTSCSLPTPHDEFSEAFQLLISCESFISLLNAVSDEMGYLLDLKWVDYVHEQLNLVHEVKWIELFKVFKIDFVQDLKELKEKMMPYCKINQEGEVVFDINGAIDGFLNFVWLKRQSPSDDAPKYACNTEDYTIYWDSVSKIIPKSLLWESVEKVLEDYWKLLEQKSILMQRNMNLAIENKEWENSLKNFHQYGTTKM